jgi:hypothetical protein
MWMLSFVPDSLLEMIVNGILVLGAISTFLSFFVINRLMRFFPPLANWHTLLQVLSVVIFTAGVYFKGSYQTEAEWRARVAEVQAKVQEAEQQSNQLNQALAEERKKKRKVRVEYYNTVKTEIKEVEKLINTECNLNPKVNELHNKAAKNPEAAK